MWLRNLFGIQPNRKKTLESAFDPIEIDLNPAAPLAFREFTPPPRRQSSGGFRLGVRQGGGVGRIGIIPFAGVKVP